MDLDADGLVGYLRAEYSASAKWRVFSFLIGLIVALPAVGSIVTTDAKTLYYLAALNIFLVAIWLVVNHNYNRKKNAAHAARRAALIVNGLGEELSAGEKRRLSDKFTVSADRAKKSQKSDYYATEAAPGPSRLLESLEESAFYSSKLHASSANAWIGIVIFYAFMFAALAIFVIPSATNDYLMLSVRIFFAATVFVLSADVLGSLMAHRRCARETGEILSRIEISKKDAVNNADALHILEDYTSAIQGAPEILPLIYKKQESSLNRLWNAYRNG